MTDHSDTTPAALQAPGRWDDRPWGEPWAGDAGLLARADGITEIGLSRSMCHGMCPVYTLTFVRSGEATFLGEYFVALMGLHAAMLDVADLRLLARAITHLGFDSLDPAYAAPVTDMPTLRIWVRRGAEAREVSEYGDAAPENLYLIERLIDELGSRLDWRSVPAEPVPDDGRPIFVGSSLQPTDLAYTDPSDEPHWTQRAHWLERHA